MTQYKPMPIVANFEDAIEFVRREQEDCGIEWYSLGKTNADLLAHLKTNNIDTKTLEVFIGGSPDNSPECKLYFCPRAWMAVDGSARARSVATSQPQGSQTQ